MKKWMICAAMLLISTLSFAGDFGSDKASEVDELKIDKPEKRAVYRGKASLITNGLGLVPMGLTTVHGAYFPKSGFFIGASLTSRLSFLYQTMNYVAVHPEWYFVRNRKIDWSMSVEAGFGRTYEIPEKTDNGYYKPGYWYEIEYLVSPAIGMGINLSEKIALDISLKLDIYLYGGVSLLPMYTVGVRF